MSQNAGDTEQRRPNRLNHATSPYLLQHAHNPVDWYEWDPEALERAREEDKPIFLSIGYSACHWCHVMERECFENQQIAAVMNEFFVCIKVDREERPDLDEIYMMATQVFTRSGGWPMSVWLTPDQRPFFAGTYFPPRSSHGRPGFEDVLRYLARVWREERDKVIQQADALTDAVKSLTVVEPGDELPPYSLIPSTAEVFARAFDTVQGGISGGGTNKFPPSMSMDLMLRAYHASTHQGEPKAGLLRMVELTLDKMAHGGIYDQIGGGICRYSTDVDWLVPHFEKMLYDQALVSDIYQKAYQLTRKPLYARIAREIHDYVIADLQGPEGGFYSSRDADSEGVEGKFYIWTFDEVRSALGENESALFCDYYDITPSGNWEGHNIPNVPRPIEVVAKAHGLEPSQLETRLTASRKKLFDLRETRVKPHLDDKILASWNGLMIASMAKAARILEDTRYQDAAARAADFVLTRMRDPNGRLLRNYRNGRTHTLGYLDDYAFMIEASLNLYETTLDIRWLDEAERLNRHVMEHYRDADGGGFFFTADDAEKTLIRSRSAIDNAVPSGSSVQFLNLQRLSILLGRSDLDEEARRTAQTFGRKLVNSPFSSERMLSGMDFLHRRPKEVAIVAPARDTAANRMLDAVWRIYLPNLVVAGRFEADPAAATAGIHIPLLDRRTALHGRPTAFVCRDYICASPISDEAALINELAG
ncbi:MAG: thioredoxin domain-containing protein [Phycisphaerae bacterium]|nr:thioredoxin domain-containing protein [Phycisphaerae bacterium]